MERRVEHVTIVMSGDSKKDFVVDRGEVWAQGFMRKWLDKIGCAPDLWVDIHRDETWTGYKTWNPSYQNWLALRETPVLMFNHQPSVPTSIPVPDAVKNWAQTEPFAGSFDWMMACAIHWGAKTIALFGCDYASAHERMYQTFGAAYWIGKARGLGIDVQIPPSCPLLWNVLPGNYGPEYPPWPAEHDPRFAPMWAGGPLPFWIGSQLDRDTAFSRPRVRFPQAAVMQQET